jgi:hypothetical protein
VEGVDLVRRCAHDRVVSVEILGGCRETPHTTALHHSRPLVAPRRPVHYASPYPLISSHLVSSHTDTHPSPAHSHTLALHDPPPNTSTRPLQRQPAPPTHMSVSVPSEMGHDPYCGGPRSKHETASLACHANSSPFTVTLQALSPQSPHCESPCPPCPSSLVPDPSSAAAPPPCLLPKRGAAYR